MIPILLCPSRSEPGAPHRLDQLTGLLQIGSRHRGPFDLARIHATLDRIALDPGQNGPSEGGGEGLPARPRSVLFHIDTKSLN